MIDDLAANTPAGKLRQAVRRRDPCWSEAHISGRLPLFTALVTR